MLLYWTQKVSLSKCLRFFWQIVISLQAWKTIVLALALKEANNVFKLFKKTKSLYLRHWGDEEIYIWFQENWESGSTSEEKEWCRESVFVLSSTGAFDEQNGFCSEQGILVIVILHVALCSCVTLWSAAPRSSGGPWSALLAVLVEQPQQWCSF